MTRSRRYETQHDATQDAKRAALDAMPRPVTIPQQAYGSTPMEQGPKREVWAWVPFTDGHTRRLPGTAVAWNDRVVEFEWWTLQGGGTRSTTVWRSGVTVRTTSESDAAPYLPWMTATTGVGRGEKWRG